jgi:hypothetical protein
MMEKTFTNAILLSATVLTAFMVIAPPLHLSAQNEVVIDEQIKVRKVSVESIDPKTHSLIVKLEGLDDVSVPVRTNASTTVYIGNGDETALLALQPGVNIYVFGEYNNVTKDIEASKIVIRNKRITAR